MLKRKSAGGRASIFDEAREGDEKQRRQDEIGQNEAHEKEQPARPLHKKAGR
jgi:hypothetical protein